MALPEYLIAEQLNKWYPEGDYFVVRNTSPLQIVSRMDQRQFGLKLGALELLRLIATDNNGKSCMTPKDDLLNLLQFIHSCLSGDWPDEETNNE